jgi:hypothetical protein
LDNLSKQLQRATAREWSSSWHCVIACTNVGFGYDTENFDFVVKSDIGCRTLASKEAHVQWWASLSQIRIDAHTPSFPFPLSTTMTSPPPSSALHRFKRQELWHFPSLLPRLLLLPSATFLSLAPTLPYYYQTMLGYCGVKRWLSPIFVFFISTLGRGACIPPLRTTSHGCDNNFLYHLTIPKTEEATDKIALVRMTG